MLRLVFAYLEDGRESTPEVLYCGHDADAAIRIAQACDPAYVRVDIATAPQTRRAKRDPGAVIGQPAERQWTMPDLRRAREQSLAIIEEFRATIAELGSSGKAQSAKIDELSQSHDRITGELSTANSLLTESGNQVTSLQVQLTDSRAETEALRVQLAEANERAERNREMWQGQVERQSQELTALRALTVSAKSATELVLRGESPSKPADDVPEKDAASTTKQPPTSKKKPNEAP